MTQRKGLAKGAEGGAPRVGRARLRRAEQTPLAERDELAHAAEHGIFIGGATKELEQAQHARQPPQQTEARVFGATGRVGLVPKISVLGVGRNLVMHGGRAQGGESMVADLLAELVEAQSHGAAACHRAEARPTSLRGPLPPHVAPPFYSARRGTKTSSSAFTPSRTKSCG